MLAFHEIGLDELSHKNVAELIVFFEKTQAQHHSIAVNTIRLALSGLYGGKKLSLQQLAATFRRGDLLDYFTTLVGKTIQEQISESLKNFNKNSESSK